MKQPIGLGKGLGEILGGVPNADQIRKPVGYVNREISSHTGKIDGAEIFKVNVDAIEANPFQPRMSFDQAALEELAASIKTLGLIQPITLRKLPQGRYQIISGERRFRACRLIGMASVPAYVREADDQGMLEMAIVENLQRSDLGPIELAVSYQRLLDECQLTQEQLAERVSKGRATVANTLRLLKLPAKVQHDLKVGQISVGHAKAILGADDPAVQEQLCDVVVRDGLSVRQLESLVRKLQLTPGAMDKSPRKEPELPLEYNRLKKRLSDYFTEEVTLKRAPGGKGTLTVRFSSDEEVCRFLEVLEKQN